MTKMVVKSTLVRRVVYSLFCLFCFMSTSAFAIRLELNCSSIPEDCTGPVQLMLQVGDYDTPGGGDDREVRLVNIVGGSLTNTPVPLTVSSCSLTASGGIDVGTSGGLLDITAGSTLYLRIWDGDTKQGNRYAYVSLGAITWGETDPAVSRIASSWSTYLADVPGGVSVGVNSEVIARTGTGQQLQLGIVGADNGQTEVRTWVLEVSKDAGFADVADATGGAKHFAASSATASGAYFTQGTYYLRAQAGNYYGTTSLLTTPVRDIANPGASVTDAVGRYTTLASGGGAAGPETITFPLTRPTDGLGINVISFPFNRVDGTLGSNFHVRGLVNAINTAAGSNVVQTIGWWDNDSKLPSGYIVTYPASGAEFSRIGPAPAEPATAGTAAVLGRDRSLQISVSAPASLTLTGSR